MTTPRKALGGAFKGLRTTAANETPAAAPAPAPASVSLQPAPVDDTPIGVVVRFNPRDHKTVSDYAGQLDMSIQELVETAINKMRAAEGLSQIEGRPRSKTRRRRR